MIDRINESQKLKELLNETCPKQTILINGESGAGTSYFVNSHFLENERIIFKRESITDTFAICLFKTIVNQYLEKFKEFLNEYEVDYIWNKPKINFFQDGAKNLIEYLANSYKDNSIDFVFEYSPSNPKHIKPKKKGLFNRNKEPLKTLVIKRKFRQIITEFIDILDEKFLIYDKFDSKEDSELIQDFIAYLHSKVNILIVESKEYYSNYEHNCILLTKFENVNYFLELLRSQITLQSETSIKHLADKLYYTLKGSPKELILLINHCRHELQNCQSDEDIIETISKECKIQLEILTNTINLFILQDLYLAGGSLSYNFIIDFIGKQTKLSSERIIDNIDLLFKNGLLEISGIDIILTGRAKAYLSLELFKDKHQSHKIYLDTLASINNYIPAEMFTDLNVQKLIANTVLSLNKIGQKENTYNHIVKNYADKLLKNNNLSSAAEMYSILADHISSLNYNEIYEIAKLLYEEGYYKESFSTLLNCNVDKLNKSTKFNYYLLLANCNMLIDNKLAIEFFNNAITLDTKDKLIAIAYKLLCELETREINDVESLKDEYYKIIKTYEKTPRKSGYITLLRIALDFQDNDTAIATMRKGLSLAEHYGMNEEIYKFKQNIALNLIRGGCLDEAEKLLYEVHMYCIENSRKELSYPLINLSAIKIFKFFESGNFDYAVAARDFAMSANDSASSYYAITLSNLFYITSLSILYTMKNNPYNISHDHLRSLREYRFSKVTNNLRMDHRSVVKPCLSLIASACLTDDFDQAEKYLRELCKHKNNIGKAAIKVNRYISQLGITDIEKLQETEIDKTCQVYQTETRFEPWLISLTHY